MILCANPSAQFQSYQAEIEEAALAVMRGNRFILGEAVESLEQEFANYIGTSEAIGVANGTDAIELALRALNIGTGDEVITVSHTAVATVAAIEVTGAIPVLVDVEPQFYTLDPLQLAEVITTNTKAIIAVHLYGQAADLDSIFDFCKSNNLYLIEDCAQAHGAKYKGRRLGSIGDIGCFSCYPTKNLGAIGDAGLITTSNELATKIRKLREYGWSNRISEYKGRNSRLDEMQAAILRIKLKYLDSDNEKRRQLAAYYNDQLSNLPIKTPEIRAEVESVYHLYVIQVMEQQKFIEYLLDKGIQVGIHYPVPVHLQPAYKNRVRLARNMRVTEDLVDRIISLPMYPELSISDAEKIINTIKSFLNRDSEL
ncbi:MAG: dTDP-4-amino-4,6-dideoxygalactose transaminase [Methylophilaceae bacterium]|jgi:dTDP-4-amino-4,6-dideoxygalactose transaminase